MLQEIPTVLSDHFESDPAEHDSRMDDEVQKMSAVNSATSWKGQAQSEGLTEARDDFPSSPMHVSDGKRVQVSCMTHRVGPRNHKMPSLSALFITKNQKQSEDPVVSKTSPLSSDDFIRKRQQPRKDMSLDTVENFKSESITNVMQKLSADSDTTTVCRQFKTKDPRKVAHVSGRGRVRLSCVTHRVTSEHRNLSRMFKSVGHMLRDIPTVLKEDSKSNLSQQDDRTGHMLQDIPEVLKENFKSN
eukprot:12915744-Ditylum_brightwellii.AAC.1